MAAAAFPPTLDPSSPESKAVACLSREVPSWERENHCFSCHNNGDAARALYVASRAGHAVSDPVLVGTSRWLARPSQWNHNGGDGPSSDKGLARVAFTSTLAAAVETGAIADRAVLARAADDLRIDQAEDGSWPIEGEGLTGSPATYGRALATLLARESLAAARMPGLGQSIKLANRWLAALEPKTVAEAAVVLWADTHEDCPIGDNARTRALEIITTAQSDDGGWGMLLKSPSEAFDTALVVISLAKTPRPSERVRQMIARGRRYLIATQSADGSWVETTRPAGNISYAQRISTTGWATLALLESRRLPSAPVADPKR
jgi:hypothetical protein